MKTKKFEIPINSNRDLIKDENWYLKSIWPKIKELND
jgi:hypothetical protein